MPSFLKGDLLVLSHRKREWWDIVISSDQGIEGVRKYYDGVVRQVRGLSSASRSTLYTPDSFHCPGGNIGQAKNALKSPT